MARWDSVRVQIAASARDYAVPLCAHEQINADAVTTLAGNARVVALGEATHGTSEFRRLRNSMVRELASKGALRVVALEISFSDGLLLDAWAGKNPWQEPLLTSNMEHIEAGELLPSLSLWSTVEERDLLLWLRSYNSDLRVDQQIHLVGVDVCWGPACARDLLSYFEQVDGQFADRARRLLTPMLNADLELSQSLELAERAHAGLLEIQDRLEQQREAYSGEAGPTAWSIASRLARLNEWRIEIAVEHGASPVSKARDEVMADNMIWALDTLADGGRALVYAHNGHTDRVRQRMPNGRLEAGLPMGAFLSKYLDQDYFVLHTTFDSGTFLAHNATLAHSATPWFDRHGIRQIEKFTLRAAPPGTLEADLRGFDSPTLLDVRRSSISGDLEIYMEAEHWTRFLVAAWKPILARTPIGWSGIVPADAFDALVYFPTTTATTPLGQQD